MIWVKNPVCRRLLTLGLLAYAALTFPRSLPSWAQNPEEPIAWVNNEPIPLYAFTEAFAGLKASYAEMLEADITPELKVCLLESFQQMALDRLVQTTLLRQKADEMNIKLKPGAVEKILAERVASSGGEAAFKADLVTKGLSLGLIQHQIREQLLFQALFESVTATAQPPAHRPEESPSHAENVRFRQWFEQAKAQADIQVHAEALKQLMETKGSCELERSVLTEFISE